jgi:hypothetical protein
MGSASQQLPQRTNGGALSPCMAYLLLCDAMFGDWLSGSVLASFQSTSAFFAFGFLPSFLVGFVSFFYT